MITHEQLFNHLYYRKLPQLYRDADAEQMTYPLKRFLAALIEGGFAAEIEDINKFATFIDPENCPDELVPYLCKSFGLPYFEDIDIIFQRRFLMNVGEIIKRRGTFSGVKLISRTLTGLNTKLKYEAATRTLTVTLLADTLEEINNMDTSMAVVKEYLTSHVPFYVNIVVNSEINFQRVQSCVHRANVLTTGTWYSLVPPNIK